MAKQDRSMKKLTTAVLTGAIGLLCAAVAGGASASRPKQLESVPGEFVVELRQEQTLTATELSVLQTRLGGQISRQVRPGMFVVKRSVRENVHAAAQAMAELPEVLHAEPNYIFHALAMPNDPDLKKVWGINNSGELDSEGTRGMPGIDVGAEKAWDIQTGSKDVVVAVVDTGVDYTHPDLKNNIWTNAAEANGKAGVDDDANGFIDDIHGYNFVADNGDPKDDNGHGSHCSGTIGAEGNNGTGIVGVNWHVSIMAVKFLDQDGGGSLENAVKALDYAIKMKAQVLSNSWGGNGQSDILKDAVGRTQAAGQLFVAAAGNNSGDNDSDDTAIPSTYPYDNILSVAAVDNRGQLAYFSNFGAKRVHVAAPGVNVYSTSMNGRFETLTGTSMAAPHVAGIAALLLANEPGLTDLQVKSRIIAAARPLKGLGGKTVSGGIADAYYTLSGLTPPADPNDPSIWTDRVAFSAASDHPYKEKTSKSFTIQVAGAKRLSVHFSKFETEAGYDKVQFLDSTGASYGYYSGVKTDQFGPIIEGDTVVLKFESDSSVNGYGFDVDSVAVER